MGARKEVDLEELRAEMESLRPSYDRFREVSEMYRSLVKASEKRAKLLTLNRICSECCYVDPQYPSIGYPGSDGSAIFQNKDQADVLVRVLCSNSTYYHGYILEWDGPGVYAVVPSYRHDHDGDVVYTATFVKA